MRICFCLAGALLLSACGYRGDPLPPALKRPMHVSNLAAAERGAKIIVTFTMPVKTTEDLPLENPEIDLRLGIRTEGEWHQSEWERIAERVPVTVPAPDQKTVEAAIDALKYANKNVVIAVRVLGPKGQSDGWSNLVNFSVVPPLAAPLRLTLADIPGGVRVQWQSSAAETLVFRKAADQTAMAQLGVSNNDHYDDLTAEMGKQYQYRVRAARRAGENYAESEDSAAAAIEPKDKFPPPVPAGVNAAAGTRTIELGWDRITVDDLAEYRVYRNGQRIAAGLTAPAFSDKDVVATTTYRYQVSAVDQAGNESERSAAIEAVIP